MISEKSRERLGITAATMVILVAMMFMALGVFIAISYHGAQDQLTGLSGKNHVQIVDTSAGVATLDNDGTYIYIRLNQICAKVQCGPAPPLPVQVKPKP